MSLERVVEEIIQEAMARGEFDNLPGMGKPLDLDAYFALPEDQRLAITMLKEKLSVCSDRVEREHLNREINDRTLKFNLLQGQKQQAKRKARKIG